MASTPPRLWCGVPANIDPLARRELGGGSPAPWRRLGGRLEYVAQNMLRFNAGGFFKHDGDIVAMSWRLFPLYGQWVDHTQNANLAPNTTYYVFMYRPMPDAPDYIVPHYITQAGGVIRHAPSVKPGNEGNEVYATPSGDPLWPFVNLLAANEQAATFSETFIDQSNNHVLDRLGAAVNYLPIWQSNWESIGGGVPSSVVQFSSGFQQAQLLGSLLRTQTNLTFGTQDFCVEAWLKPNLTYNPASKVVFTDNANSWFQVWIEMTGAGVGSWLMRTSWGAGWQGNTLYFGTVDHDVWQHIAVYRVGNLWFGAKNGAPTQIMNTGAAVNIQNANQFCIGGDVGYTAPYFGRAAGVRVTIGNSRYTAANFTPPPAPIEVGNAVATPADDNMTLIGIIRTNQWGLGPGFADFPNFRGVRSWNDRRVVALRGDNIPTDVWFGQVAPGPLEISTGKRVGWVQWADEVVALHFLAGAYNGGASQVGWFYVNIGVDNPSIQLPPEQLEFHIWPTYSQGRETGVILDDLAEGFHEGIPTYGSWGNIAFRSSHSGAATGNPRIEGTLG